VVECPLKVIWDVTGHEENASAVDMDVNPEDHGCHGKAVVSSASHCLPTSPHPHPTNPLRCDEHIDNVFLNMFRKVKVSGHTRGFR
jgi:hypothetical protein